MLNPPFGIYYKLSQVGNYLHHFFFLLCSKLNYKLHEGSSYVDNLPQCVIIHKMRTQ